MIFNKIFLLNPCLARSAINQYRYNYNSTKLISYIKCACADELQRIILRKNLV